MNPDTKLCAVTPISSYNEAPTDALLVGPMAMIMENVPDSVARRDSIRESKRTTARCDEDGTGTKSNT
jgi:hypothetical protein